MITIIIGIMILLLLYLLLYTDTTPRVIVTHSEGWDACRRFGRDTCGPRQQTAATAGPEWAQTHYEKRSI